jgi:hypothetical protein
VKVNVAAEPPELLLLAVVALSLPHAATRTSNIATAAPRSGRAWFLVTEKPFVKEQVKWSGRPG